MTRKTSRRCYRIDRSRISFVKFILEAYDNVAVVSTVDARAAVVRVAIAPGCEALVDGIMLSLAAEGIGLCQCQNCSISAPSAAR